MKSGAGSLKKINKIDTPLARPIKKKNGKDPNKQNHKLKKRNNNQHQGNINKYKTILWETVCQQIVQQEEMDKFPETYILLRLDQEKMKSLNGPINSNKLKSVIKYTPQIIQNQTPSQVNSTNF